MDVAAPGGAERRAALTPTRVLVVNAGSSSLKLALLGADDRPLATTTVQRWVGADDLAALSAFLGDAGSVDAVGHRVVHGGPEGVAPARVDPALVERLAALTDLAPLHQPRSLAGIAAVGRLLPDVPAVACFDTAFHATIQPPAATYALPREWNERFRLRRYGFHGLSHAYAVRRGTELAGLTPGRARVVSCHLGAGASLAAVRDGRCVDTTMGFTPLEGLVMATRSGSVDPGLLLWLLDGHGIDVAGLRDTLEHGSGLAGLSGTSGDLRDVLAARADGDAAAALAYDVFVHRIARETAAMTVAAGGLDLLVFTGGIGEHSPDVRSSVATALAHLGVRLDDGRNQAADADAVVGAHGEPVATVVVTAREDLEIARQTRWALSGAG